MGARVRSPDGWRAAWLILAITIVARAVVAAAYPLLPDETYFWEWSRHLAAGYYDHPPGIAWTIASGTMLFGDTTFGVRAASLVLSGVAAAALIVAARDIGGPAAALRASLVFALLPLSSGLIFAMPDAPLAACVSLVILASVRATDATRHATAWWLVAGAAAGLAMATKLSGVFAPAGVALACALIPAYRRSLRSVGPYAAALIATLILLPFLRWNAAHDWVAFGFQLDHGLGTGRDDVRAVAARVFAFIGGQLLVSGVVLGVLMTIAWLSAVRGHHGDRARYLAVLTATALVPFAVSAFRRRVEPNWTAVAFPALVVLLATSDMHVRAPRAFRAGIVVAALLVAFAYARALGALPSALVPYDPMAQAEGWRDLARAVESRVVSHPDRRTFLAADRYQDASEIAFHARGKPFARALNLDGRANQYDLWPGFPDLASRGDRLVVALPLSPRHHPLQMESRAPVDVPRVVEMLTPHFERARLDTIVTGVDRRGRDLRGVWVFEEWRGSWPERR